jgi:uncharacterized membrane protein
VAFVPPSVWIILAPVLLIAAVSVLLPLLVKTSGRPPDDKWKGVFYSNADDPAVLVPKRYGIGYTLNFGNPWSWVVLALILLLVVAPIAFSIAGLKGLLLQRGK